MTSRWRAQYLGLAAALAAAAVLGLVVGGMAWWLLGAVSLYLARVLWNARGLERALSGDPPGPAFPTRGAWADLFGRISRYRSKSRSRKKKFHKLARQVRESTSALVDGGVILDESHEIQWFNAAATRLLGLDPVMDIGNRIENLLRHPDFVAYLARPGEEGVMVPSPREEKGWLDVQIIPYGRSQRLLIVRDVTRQVRLETMRRDFVANASHELRSPVTVISGYLDTLTDDQELPEGWRAPIAEMQRQAERMSRILQDLIELARLEAAEDEAPRVRLDVCALLASLREEYATADGPAIELALATDAALLAHEPEIDSIVRNLLENAIRFTPASGTVTMEWRTEPAGGVLEVADTGIGIAEDLIPRITERFYRVDAGRSRASGGTGLGLAIVKHALQRHGAVLRIDSREGEGSRFSCHFPRDRVIGADAAARAAV